MENQIQMDDLGVPTIDLKPPYTIWSFNKAMENHNVWQVSNLYTHV